MSYPIYIFVLQTMIAGRAMRITLDDKCTTVTDLDTGFKSSKCVDTAVVGTPSEQTPLW